MRTGLIGFGPVLKRFEVLKDWSQSQSCSKKAKDQTEPDFQALVQIGMLDGLAY